MRAHSGIVHSVAWSPDGKRIASASEDKTVQVWDAIDGGHVFIYRGHSGIVHSVAWSPDGKRIASASEDKTVQVWDAIDGGHVHTYPEASSLYDTAVTWSPDGKRIVSLDNDELIQVWDPTTGDIFYSYAPPSQPLAIALSPNGKYIACGNDLQGPTYVIDATTGDNIYTYHSSYDFIQVYALAWSPDSTCIAIGGAVAYMSNVVEVFTATTGSNIITHMGHDEQTVSVAWSPDGKRIASGGTNATVQVWDATTGNTIYIYHNRLNA